MWAETEHLHGNLQLTQKIARKLTSDPYHPSAATSRFKTDKRQASEEVDKIKRTVPKEGEPMEHTFGPKDNPLLRASSNTNGARIT